MKFLLFLSVSLLLCACKSKDNSTKAETAKPLEEIYFYKGPCFGKCPTYELRVMSDDKLHFKGINFVEPVGEFSVKGTEGVFADLKNLMKRNGFSQLENSYMMGISDIPTLRISSGGKSIEFNYGKAPEGLKEIVTYLQDLRKSTKWK